MIKEFQAKPRSRVYSFMELTVNEWKQEKMTRFMITTYKDGNFNALGSQSLLATDPHSLSFAMEGSKCVMNEEQENEYLS